MPGNDLATDDLDHVVTTGCHLDGLDVEGIPTQLGDDTLPHFELPGGAWNETGVNRVDRDEVAQKCQGGVASQPSRR